MRPPGPCEERPTRAPGVRRLVEAAAVALVGLFVLLVGLQPLNWLVSLSGRDARLMLDGTYDVAGAVRRTIGGRT